MIGSLIIGMGRASFFLQIFLFWFGKLLLSVSVRGLSRHCQCFSHCLKVKEGKWYSGFRKWGIEFMGGNWQRRKVSIPILDLGFT